MNTTFQYEPLPVPVNWNAEERRLLTRLTDILDDIYLKYGRIGEKELASSVNGKISGLTPDGGMKDGGKLKADAIEAVTAKLASVTAESVSTDRLAAAIADIIRMRVGIIDADHVSVDELAAAIANIQALLVEQINADNIETDRLAAALGRFVTLYAQVGEFDFATVANLTAEAMVLRQGVGGSVYIDNLVATSANFVAATLGELVIKGGDGKYYRVEVASDGTIRTVEVTPSAAEIVAGETAGGLGIVETTANVQSLNAQTVKASSAIIGDILTGALVAEKITAGEALIASATIPTLYVTAINAIGNHIDISANDSITFLTGMGSRIDMLQNLVALKVSTGDLETYLRVESDGVYVGKTGDAYSVRITGSSVDVVTDNNVVASFRDGQIKLGTYSFRKTADNGMAFTPL